MYQQNHHEDTQLFDQEPDGLPSWNQEDQDAYHATIAKKDADKMAPQTRRQLSAQQNEIDFGLPDEKIAALKARFENVEADTAIGYNQIKAGITEARKYRTSVEKARKLFKADALEWGRKVDKEAKRLTELLLEVELPLKDKKQAVDDEAERLRKEAEQAKLEAERKEREEREAAERAKQEAAQEAIRIQQQAQQDAIDLERAKLAHEREAIEQEKQQLYEERREREAAEQRKRELAEDAEREAAKAKQEEARQQEAERLEKERLPDREKLQQLVCDLHEFHKTKVPKMSTDWGRNIKIEVGCTLLELVETIETNVNVLDQSPAE